MGDLEIFAKATLVDEAENHHMPVTGNNDNWTETQASSLYPRKKLETSCGGDRGTLTTDEHKSMKTLSNGFDNPKYYFSKRHEFGGASDMIQLKDETRRSGRVGWCFEARSRAGKQKTGETEICPDAVRHLLFFRVCVLVTFSYKMIYDTSSSMHKFWKKRDAIARPLNLNRIA